MADSILSKCFSLESSTRREGQEVNEEDIDVDDICESKNLTLKEFRSSKKFPSSICEPSEIQQRQIKKILILCNPISGKRAGAKIAEKVLSIFTRIGIDSDLIYLRGKGHCEYICKNDPINSLDIICVVGGDGTLHECINGILKRGDEDYSKIPLAIIPAGTGNSLFLEIQGKININKSIRHILRGIFCPIDVFKINFPHLKEEDRFVYSFNSLHWGLGSKVNVLAEKMRWMGSSLRYTTATLLEIFKAKKTYASIKFEDSFGKITQYNEEFCLLIANNIVTASKGMKLAPKAKINDGLIDLMLIRTSNPLELAQIFMNLYDGSHVDLPTVEYIQVKRFSLVPYPPNCSKIEDESNFEPEEYEEIIDIDGELKGVTPFDCTVFPKSINIVL